MPVSVVVPVLNEERHLAEAVHAALDQRYDGPIDVALALGPSTDRTDEVAHALREQDSRVVLVANPGGRTPDALNAAVAATSSPVVVRVDGHGVLDPDYVATAVDLLRQTGAANVGGLMDAEGSTAFERAVAAAMTSPLGVGAARFHVGGAPGPADTVYLGVFRREWLQHVGGYDPEFIRAQDWEMNHRIRQDGGLVWFSPRLRVSYRPRGTVRALARQYRDYGRWRRVVARTHAGTVNLRYLAPPLALVGVVAGAVVGATLTPWGLLLPGGYAGVVLLGTLVVGRRPGTRLPLRARLLLPVVLPTMHLSWGWGFLTSPASIVPSRERAEGVEE
ncbi:MAG TPA: glycosyltransferase family 2 protein [Actinomycetales bacterium]|nr:glycosyltransferase family 2 protein [Actinomycetales bacterium]